MPRAREELTAGEWAALALLTEEPTHGFAIARALAPDGEVGRVWSLRRPLVYRALETLSGMGLARPVGTLPSSSGPQRTILETTIIGQRRLAGWLDQPVAHVRDARSLLMLKLLFLARRQGDLEPLLSAQRVQFARLAEGLSAAADQAGGFDRALLLWRVENTTAAIRFTERMLTELTPPLDLNHGERLGRPSSIELMDSRDADPGAAGRACYTVGMDQPHVISMLLLHPAAARDEDAREQLAAALPGAEVSEPDQVGVFTIMLEAADQEAALTRVWDAVAASGTDDHIVFLEHPDLPGHWRHRSQPFPG